MCRLCKELDTSEEYPLPALSGKTLSLSVFYHREFGYGTYF